MNYLRKRRGCGGSALNRSSAWLLPAVAVFVAVVGVVATFGPARRILAIQPTDALRSDS